MSNQTVIYPSEEEYVKYESCKQRFKKYLIWLNANKNVLATLKKDQRNAIIDLRTYWNKYKKEDKLFVLALHNHHKTISTNSGNDSLWRDYLLKVIELSKDLYAQIPRDEHECSDENCNHNNTLENLGITKEDISKVRQKIIQQYNDEFGCNPLDQSTKEYQKDELIKLLVDNYKFWMKRLPSKEEKDFSGEDKATVMMCKVGMKSLMEQAEKLKITKEVLEILKNDKTFFYNK